MQWFAVAVVAAVATAVVHSEAHHHYHHHHRPGIGALAFVGVRINVPPSRRHL